MRPAPLLALALLAAAPPRTSLGQFARWGAFREGGRCFALAEPLGRGGGTLAMVSGGGARVQLHVSLARAGPATLKIGTQTFPLQVRGTDAWARDDREDLRILRAFRRGEAAVVVAGGRRTRYALAGFPSAVDAALVGCAALENRGVSP